MRPSTNSVEHSSTRFFVNEKIYLELLSNPRAEYILKVTPITGRHPKGVYKIPNTAIVKFIEGKRGDYNWKQNETYHQDGIPRDLANYFRYR